MCTGRAGDSARLVAAHVLLHTREFGIAVAIAVLVFLPSGRERVLVDAEGVHTRALLPFFDRDVPWSNVAKPTLISVSKGRGHD